jgi:hypothetical protein
MTSFHPLRSEPVAGPPAWHGRWAPRSWDPRDNGAYRVEVAFPSARRAFGIELEAHECADATSLTQKPRHTRDARAGNEGNEMGVKAMLEADAGDGAAGRG